MQYLHRFLGQFVTTIVEIDVRNLVVEVESMLSHKPHSWAHLRLAVSQSFAFFCALLLMLCGNAKAQTNSEASRRTIKPPPLAQNADVEKYIDPSITGEARRIIAEVLRATDENARENVVYFTGDGKAYANKPGLLELFETPTQTGQNQYRFKNGEVINYPALTQKPQQNLADGMLGRRPLISPLSVTPTPTGGSGPYRRVYSKPGYAWQQSKVHLSTSANISTGREINIMDISTGETAFTYAGGWGDLGGAVDAGFQYSSTNDDWALFIRYEVPGSGSLQHAATGVRFRANQDVSLKFLVMSNNNVQTVASGLSIAGKSQTLTVIQNMDPSFGWHLNGSGNVLKRMTSIGQSPPEDLTTGSYHKKVHWYNSVIGLSSTNNHVWISADSGGAHSYPNATVSSGLPIVSPAEETDNIIIPLF